MDERGKNVLIKKTRTRNFVKILRNVVPILITLGLLVFLVYYVNPQTLLETISNVDVWVVFVAFLISVLMIGIRVIRWRYILSKMKIELNYWKATQLVFIGSFGASITPAKVGDVVRAFYLSRWTNVSETTSLFSVVLDRVMDLICIGLLSIVAIPFYFMELNLLIKWSIFGGLLIVALVVFFTFNRALVKKLVLLISRLRRGRRKETDAETMTEEESIEVPKSASIVDSYYSNLNYFSLTHFIVLILLSLVFWILLGVEVGLLIFSLSGTSMSFQGFLTITSIMSIAAIASLVPISLSGIGIRDITITALLLYGLHISAEFAFSTSLIQTAFNMLLPALAGGLLLFFLRSKKKIESD